MDHERVEALGERPQKLGPQRGRIEPAVHDLEDRGELPPRARKARVDPIPLLLREDLPREMVDGFLHGYTGSDANRSRAKSRKVPKANESPAPARKPRNGSRLLSFTPVKIFDISVQRWTFTDLSSTQLVRLRTSRSALRGTGGARP